MQDNHSRSRRGTLRGIHFQTHPGQGKLVRCARGTVLDVVVDLRRGSPTFGEWEGVELDDVEGASCGSRSASGTASACSPRPPTSSTSARTTTTRRPRRGSASTTPTSGSSGRDVELLYSERDRDGAAAGRHRGLAAVHGVSATAASPRARPGRCTSATCARRCWRGCSRARPGARSCADGGPRHRAACGRGSPSEQLADLAAIGLDWDGEVEFQSARARASTRPRSRALRAAGPVYECFCTRAEIRAAASAPHGPLPEGAYPGTCRELTAAELAARARRGARRRCGCARTRRAVGFDGPRARPLEGVVDDFVVRRNDGAPAYNLAVVVDDAAQGIGEVVRGADLVDSTPRQLWLARALGLPEPALCPRAAGARAGRRAAGQAPRRR